ncbi:MAG: hypothetical protein QOK90_10835 [Nitrososphaeraceae archaeon]|nr:hypothetical protein [Nitrososphaeraceae archaeon]
MLLLLLFSLGFSFRPLQEVSIKVRTTLDTERRRIDKKRKVDDSKKINGRSRIE